MIMGTKTKETMKKKPKNSTADVAATITKSNKRTRKPKPKPEPGFPIGDIEDFQFREDEVGEIRASLLKWYDVNKRDLPWRRISDDGERDRKAYAVWVSEIMLQQTRVQTVVNYFNRWMEKWPTVHHLAQASIEEVNEMWAGLGYYRRARFLLEGAQMIVEGGQFPRSVNDLRRVRGIGEYTAGAIASIAFNEAVPVVDGNVVRVIARLKTISANPKDTATVKNIWRLAGQLVDRHRPGDFNQALMELGAMLCTPLSPSCSSCPVSAQCSALSESKHNPSMFVTDYPTKVAKVRQRHDFSAISVVEILEGEGTMNTSPTASKFLLVKRPEEGLLAGLWEFPSVSLNGEAELVTRRQAIDDFLKSSFGLNLTGSSNIVAREEVGEYVHIFTHIRLKMYIELLVLRSQDLHNRKKDKALMSYKYVDTKTLASMGLSTGVRKAYNMVQKFKQSRSSLIKR